MEILLQWAGTLCSNMIQSKAKAYVNPLWLVLKDTLPGLVAMFKWPKSTWIRSKSHAQGVAL